MAAARVEPVANVSGVAGLVGEVVELKLHEHQQAVQPVAVAQDVAPRCEPVADLVEPTVQAGYLRLAQMPLGGRLMMDHYSAAGWPVGEQQERRNLSLRALETHLALRVAVARPLLVASQLRLC